MTQENGTESQHAVAALEHLTGPSRGTITWLTGSVLDVSLGASQFIHVSDARAGEPRRDLVARLHRAGESYEIEAVEGFAIWINGDRVAARKLDDCDMIEFGESGPLSRFTLYGEDAPVRTRVLDILSDAAAYLRVSRQPVVRRAYRAVCQVVRRLARQTTILFRITVISAILVLAGLSYQQLRLNALLEQRIESGASRVDDFARALSRARQEALTPNDLQALRRELGGQLLSNAERLAELERRSSAGARVVAQSASSILFLQGAYGFREVSSGRMLRQVVDADGSPLISPLGQPLLSLEGEGPVAERQFTGTGFAVRDLDILVTNRHVARPWESDATDVEALAVQGLEPVMTRFVAYVPTAPTAHRVNVLRISDEADLAVLRAADASGMPAGLDLATEAPEPGEEIIVMGYPTGLRSMLVQSGDAFIEQLQKAEDTDFWSVAARLAEGGHIAPLASRGIVGQASEATVVYDAETTHGGSGGPVLAMDGSVVAVNAAILPEFGGSNLGVPVARLRALLAQAGLR